jgi:hypothetical protein
VDAGSSLRYPRSTLRADHPRAIDRYIDYFGEGAARCKEEDQLSAENEGPKSTWRSDAVVEICHELIIAA